jgi:hypothetical protein
MNFILDNPIIVTTDNCILCSAIKEELENFYPNFAYTTTKFADLPIEQRQNIREYLKISNNHLPVLLYKDGTIFKQSTEDFLRFLKEFEENN